jgi:archaellum component FlaC
MTARKPDTPPDLMLIVGQLLEATKAAAEGLKSVSVEVQGNAKAIIAVSKTIETMETQLAELNRLVADVGQPGNLVFVTAGHSTDITALKTSVKELERALETLKTTVAKLNNDHVQVSTSQKVTNKHVIFAVKILGWVITTGIAIYAAIAATGK